MTQAEFIDRMSGRWPNGFNIYVRNDLQSWLMRNNVVGARLESLYTSVAEQYEYPGFPALDFLAKCLGGAYDNRDFSKYQVSYFIEQTQHWDVEKIVKHVNGIRSGSKCGHDECTSWPCITQIMLVKAWGELDHIHGHLVDLGWEKPRIRGYLKTIKDNIVAGETISFNVQTIGKSLNIVGERTGKTKSFAEVTGTLYFQD